MVARVAPTILTDEAIRCPSTAGVNWPALRCTIRAPTEADAPVITGADKEKPWGREAPGPRVGELTLGTSQPNFASTTYHHNL
jgi:hypothetical protein